MTRESGVKVNGPIILALVVAGILLRLYRFWSIPGITCDEGWWGLQALGVFGDPAMESTTWSGNPTNPFLLYPMALVHLVLEPSGFALRLVPLLSNLLALGASYFLARRVMGEGVARVYVACMAILPAAIHQGRLARDPSQSILICSVLLFLSLETARGERWIRAGLATVACFIVALATLLKRLPPMWRERLVSNNDKSSSDESAHNNMS